MKSTRLILLGVFLCTGCKSSDRAAESSTRQSLDTATLTLTPSSGIADYQEVTVSGTGLSVVNIPEDVEIAECPTGTVVTPGFPGWPSNCLPFGMFAENTGQISVPVTVRAVLEPAGGAPISCEAPGACSVFAKVIFTQNPVVSVPINFRTMGTPVPGAVQITPSPVAAETAATVKGSGWASQSTVLVSACRTGSASGTCERASPLVLGSDGTFTTSFAVRSFLKFDAGYADCMAGECVVTVQDSRDPIHTKVETPLQLQPVSAPRGAVTSTPSGPLVDGLYVRLEGSGWGQLAQLRVLECHGDGFLSCDTLTAINADASGGFRNYVQLEGTLLPPNNSDCKAAPGACSLVVAADNGLTASQVRIPLTFSTAEQFQVTSHYEPQYETLFQQGLQLTGVSDSELQKTGAAFTGWVLAYAHAATGTHLPTTGTFSHTTTYTKAEYVEWTHNAARFDYSLEEYQKIGALFLSWIVAGMPPLPQ